MFNKQYENLRQKPRAVPFLSVCLQIILTYMFCSGTYAVYGQGLTIVNVFSIQEALKTVTEVTFEAVATKVMCLFYTGFAFGLILNTLVSWHTASSIKKIFRAEEVDILQARKSLAKLVLATRRTVFVSLAFLCWTRLLSVFSLPFSMIRALFFILLMCALVEAKAFSYIQGKRGAFSFGKTLCGYLLAALTVVAVFNLKERSLYDFVIGLIALGDASLPTTAMDWVYFLQVNVIVYLAPLCFVLALFRPFRRLFLWPKGIFENARLKRAANSYLISLILFLIATCIIFGIHEGAMDYRYYVTLLKDYAFIIAFALLIKLFSVAANSRFRLPVKILEFPVDERHTLD